MREKDDSRSGTGKSKVEERFCSWAWGKSIHHFPHYLTICFSTTHFSFEFTGLFIPRSWRTIARLLSESLESLRELHHDFRNKNHFHVNHLEPSMAYCQHTINVGYYYCYCCSGQPPSTYNRNCKVISCFICQMHTQVTNGSDGCSF